MKKIIGLILFVLMVSTAHSYSIGGAYASLISCKWGKYGYQYGNIGTYKVNGDVYQIFFGSDYCQY